MPGSTWKPSPNDSDCCVSICFVIACDSTRVDFPAFALDTSRATRARSDGVVHRPAAAISGYTCQRPATLFPLAYVPVAVLAARSGGRGCS